MRVALHRHPGIAGVVEAAEDILRAVPGVELVDLEQPAVGLMSNYFRALPAYRRELQRDELEAAQRAPASTRWSRSIMPITASCARTSATGRSAS